MSKYTVFIIFLAVLFSSCSENKIYGPVTDTEIGWEKLKNIDGGYVYSMGLAPSGRLFLGANNNLFISDDNGETWKESALKNEKIIYTLTMAPEEVYAFTEKDYFFSSDNGATWNKRIIKPDIKILDVIPSKKGKIIVKASGSILISSDKGNTWSEVPFPTYSGVNNLVINSKEKMYFSSSSDGLFSKIDNGNSWSIINTQSLGAGIYTLFVGKNDRLFAITYNFSLAYSDDEGKTWKYLSRPYLSPSIITVYEKTNGDLLIGTSSGIYLTTDMGINWKRWNNESISINRFYSGNGSVIFSSSSNHKYFLRSVDAGLTWEYKSTGITESSFNTIAVDSKNRIYAISDEGLMYNSTDNGFSWKRNSFGSLTLPIKQVIIDRNDIVYILDGKHSIYSSVDRGAYWNMISGSIPVYSMTVDSKGKIYICTNRQIIYSSDNFGRQWDKITGPDIYFGSIGVNKNNHIFVSSSYFDSDYYSQKDYSKIRKLYKSSDNGNSWELLDKNQNFKGYQNLLISGKGSIFTSTDGPFIRIRNENNRWVFETLQEQLRKLLFLTQNDNLIIGLKGSNEIYFSLDDGNSWKRSIHPIDYNNITSIAVGIDNTIYIATSGSGLYKGSALSIGMKFR